MALRPKKIKVSKSNGTINIEWDDGLESEYPLTGLRAACPCAECRGGHENMGTRGSPEMLEIPLEAGVSDELQQVDLVGNYAIQLVWKDGHSYGIYSWEFLRDLDPGVVKEQEVE
jgi:DUF971 family protein